MTKRTDNWQDVIWREWRNTDDRECAERLYPLVASEPVGWLAPISVVVLGVLGGIMGGMVSLLFNRDYWQQLYAPAGWPIAAATLWGLMWKGSVFGGGIGVVAGIAVGPRIRWGIWLGGLTPREAPTVLPLALTSLIVFGTGLGSLSARMQATGPVLHPAEAVIDLLSLALWVAAVLGLSLGVVSLLRQSPYVFDYHRRWFWWSRRPLPSAVEAALRIACEEKDIARNLWNEPLTFLEEPSRHQMLPEILVHNLQSEEWVERFAARFLLFAAGSRAMEPLRSLVESQPYSAAAITAKWLLDSVCEDTMRRLAIKADSLLCSECLVRCHAYTTRVTFGRQVKIIYTSYGCRACGQSQSFIDWQGPVAAVLDSRMTVDREEEDGVLRINWLRRKTLFDFDRVEIANATDEDVERIAMLAGNDPDATRRERYQRMRYNIAAGCSLSENSLRVLRQTFGEPS